MLDRLGQLFGRGQNRVLVEFSSPQQRIPVPVVSDGIVGNELVANGRMLPSVFLDTSTRPDLQDVLQAHAAKPEEQGEIQAIWSPHGKCTLDLLFVFKQPVATVAILSFSVPE